MKYLQLVRYQNLLLLAFMQLVFRFGFMAYQNSPLALSDFNYILLVISTVLIAAAGYVINNIFDQESDTINKPQNVVVGKSITEAAAYNIYFVLNISGVALGFYLANIIGKPSLASLFILVAAALYFYATTLKQILIVGNIVVASLLAFSVIIIGVFDLYPVTNIINQLQMKSLFSILMDFAFFAFLINFLREIVKDMEDVKGDYNQGLQTLPIIIGISRTAKLVFLVALVPFLLLLFYIKDYFVANNLFLVAIYAFVCILAPLLYFMVKICVAKTTSDFHHLSTVLKWIIFFGILGVLVISYNSNLKYYA
ncbi:geranylgeranylglycerol-phosphate geranylgeranyltransferase [Flavobacterium agrisoli]|uniref:Geranylgeranylglycerol-phosphate geranylgeranyltransferase n=1 Tax=Flavobacterium agrisoli TaxID=2793066 RepID=A0A934UIW4_9FLAO|nr:geranylgeranylglycerol-phosphate geranylgeranyltransferase [Flavobacterium agrisoli]MBK0368984.1 geranylgeranylglycerol-phosphate geranylgeranyltransferase [Flavobacterium agrisoli]